MTATMRIENGGWSYFDDDEVLHRTTDKSLATHTRWAVTAVHPVDGHEFGFVFVESAATDSLDESDRSHLQGTLDQYLVDHPKGAGWRFHFRAKRTRWLAKHWWLYNRRLLRRLFNY